MKGGSDGDKTEVVLQTGLWNLSPSCFHRHRGVYGLRCASRLRCMDKYAPWCTFLSRYVLCPVCSCVLSSVEELPMKFNYWHLGCFLLAIGFILIGCGTLLISLAGVLVIGGGLFSFFKELNKDESSRSKDEIRTEELDEDTENKV